MILEYKYGNWISVYFFYSGNCDEFLISVIKPFVDIVKVKKLSTQYFFIRYFENGPHIRLRFKCLSTDAEICLISLIKDHFKKFKSLSTFKEIKIEFVKYIPEIERYGGTQEGMTIAELQFEYSSNAILSILLKNTLINYELKLGSAIQMHLALVNSFNMNAFESNYFFNRIYKNNLFNFQYTDQFVDSICKVYYDQELDLLTSSKIIWNGLENRDKFDTIWYNSWILGMRKLSKSMQNLLKEKKLFAPSWFPYYENEKPSDEKHILYSILESYVHMTNNRLGISNIDETYLSFALKSIFEKLY